LTQIWTLNYIIYFSIKNEVLTKEWLSNEEYYKHISGIIFIRYAHSQKIGKPNNSKVQKKCIRKQVNQRAKIGYGYLCLREMNLRDRPFNLKGGGYGFFLKKIFWFPMLLKKIFWFWWRKKKKCDSEFLSYNVMLHSGKKIRASRYKKSKYSNSCVVWKKNSERNKKP
jgi:hypothetical protein